MRFMFWIFLAVALCAMGYVLWHVWCVLPFPKWGKWISVLVMAACLGSMFPLLGGGFDKLSLNVASACYDISTSSLFFFLYLLMIFLVLDVVRLVHLLPSASLHENWTTTIAVLALMLVIFIGGNIHYNNKVRVPLALTTEKRLPKDYKIVMASDLHLGYHNRRAELSRWVDLINAEKPDFVLIAGDIIDISTRPLIEEGMAEELRRIDAPVYACLGNHEYYSNEPKARKFYKDAGIRLLIDETTVVDSAITIIGRDDRTNPERKSVKVLTAGVDKAAYSIILDHQPYNLELTEQCGVDFQLSGHTHRGQVWPVSWITDAIYECSHGSHRRGSTQYYVSSGLGIWGGKYRIGTQSEYVVATLRHP